MRKQRYYIIALFIALVNVLAYGQVSHSWNKVPLDTKRVQQTENLKKTQRSRPNISMRSNPRTIPGMRALSEKTMYGYSMYNSENEEENGMIKFNSGDPEKIQIIGNPSDLAIRSGAEADGVYYILSLLNNSPEGFYSVDLETGEATLIADYIQNQDVRGAIDMSYDYSTKTMYFITNTDETPNPDQTRNSALWKVDLKDGSQKMIYSNIGASLLTLGISYDGEMYGVAREGKMYRVDPIKGTTTYIGDTGVEAWFWQSMEFDRGTGVLYWASCNMDLEGVLYTVNTENASVTELGQIGENEEVVGLYIPYDLCDPQAPAQVSNLLVNADPTGEKKATISWTNPDKTYGGSSLSSISKVEIFRNGSVVHTITDAKPGQEQSWTDNVPENAIFSYKIVAYNSIGAGAPLQISAFIGRDVPAAVINAVAKTIDHQTIGLTWDAVTEGVNKGYLDLASIRYKITRNDGVVIVKDLAEASYEDKTITKLDRYTYTIEASNVDGIGGTTITNYVINGPTLNIPFSSDFSEEDNATLWSCEDVNSDGHTFLINESDRYGISFLYLGGEEKADDWLVSPVIKIEKDKNYKCIVKARSFFDMSAEKFSICLIKDKDLSKVKMLETFDIDNAVPTEYRVNFANMPEGEYSIGIHCFSNEYNDGFVVYSALMDENNDGSVRGDVYDELNNPVENVTVSLDGTNFKAITDSDGVFEIKDVLEGTYTIRCTKLGYKNTPVTVNIKKLSTLNVELDVVNREVYSVSGSVTNEYGEKVENSIVSISGYNEYSVKTDKTGTFKIEGVYEDEKPYNISATKAFYQGAEASKNMDKNISVDFVLKDKIIPPAMATAKVEEGKRVPTIAWTQPGEAQIINKHSKEPSAAFGTPEGDEKVIYGIVCKEPIMLKAMNWMVYANFEEINVVVLALDKVGNATNKVLYLDRHASNNLYDVTNYQFINPVVAPDGCFVGIGCNEGSLDVVCTYNTDEFPFVEYFNGCIDDYTNPRIDYLENIGDEYRENFCIDVDASSLAGAGAPSVKYNVYRNGMDLLTSSAITDLSMEDNAWNTLPHQAYSYEVEAVYRNNQSARTKTNEITQDGSGIQNIGAAKVFASLASGGTQILISEPIDEIEVVAIDGRVIARDSFTDVIDVHKAAKGTYIIKMKKGGKSYNQKLIVK